MKKYGSYLIQPLVLTFILAVPSQLFALNPATQNNRAQSSAVRLEAEVINTSITLTVSGLTGASCRGALFGHARDGKSKWKRRRLSEFSGVAQSAFSFIFEPVVPLATLARGMARFSVTARCGKGKKRLRNLRVSPYREDSAASATSLKRWLQLLPQGRFSVGSDTIPDGEAPDPSVEVFLVESVRNPPDAVKSIKEYGAVGDGVTDDTAAIQAALDDQRSEDIDYYGRPKGLYFPTGTYLVSNTLSWRGCCVLLQGDGPGNTIIQLKSQTSGFQDPSNPKPVILTPAGNMSFRQNIRDLTIHVGTQNPGAVGIDWISNNTGTLYNVRIVSPDRSAALGLAMSRAWPGPALVKRVHIEGFQTGIHVAHAEYGPTFEKVTLQDIQQVGILNDGNTLALRHLVFRNVPKAITSQKTWSVIIMLNSVLEGTDQAASAITSEGLVYLRGITCQGFSSTVVVGSSSQPCANELGEFYSGETAALFSATPLPKSLGLPIAESPAFHSEDHATWGAFKPRYYGDTGELQALFNSGKTTIYFPAGVYFSYNQREILVPSSVRRIIGYSSVINGDSAGENGGGIRFTVADSSSEPLLVEGFGYGVTVDHRGSRPVKIAHGAYKYVAQAGAGDLYIEDIVGGPFVFYPGQKIWARQFNNEVRATKIINKGADLWILGLKTETPQTVISTRQGGRTELLGTLIYPADQFTDVEKQLPAFEAIDAQMSLLYSESVYCSGCGYPIHIREQRGSETKIAPRETFSGRQLYVGYPQ